ncbi:MAG: 4-alpha-glucanotransferase [Promethearchaeota archaeon]
MLTKYPNNRMHRSAGILLHPTSLFTPFGIGDLGSSAYKFINFLNKAGFSYWQILPIGPTGYLDSPYQCISALAGNPLLIAPDGLIQMKLVSRSQVMESYQEKETNKEPIQWTSSRFVDYGKVRTAKYRLFEKAFHTFQNSDKKIIVDSHSDFSDFCNKNTYWLDNFVLFFSLKQEFDLKSWVEWPDKYKFQEKNAINEWIQTHQQELNYYKFIQWIFNKQWHELRSYANQHGVSIIGDMPIFVAHDSVDVWMHKELFTLNLDGSLKYQAGVPPDYFSKTGQLWGNPLYLWKKLKKTKYSWWIQRFRRFLELVDQIRIDHFRGFEAYWCVKGEAKNAVVGKWIKAPGEELFKTLLKKFGKMPIIAENLGLITPKVEQMRKKFDFPGMHVLQFGFSSDGKNPHILHNFRHYSVAYTGTHDNNTTLGWWNSKAAPDEKDFIKEYLESDLTDIVRDLIRALYRSVATLAIIPMQDFLGEDSKARMNTPSVPEGNWKYRMLPTAIDETRVEWFHELAVLYGRFEKIKESKMNNIEILEEEQI